MMKWRFCQKSDFADKLLECRCVESNFKFIINELPYEIKNSIQSDNNTPKIELMNTINACLNYTNGIEKFLEIIIYLEDSSKKIQVVYKSLAQILNPFGHIKNVIIIKILNILLTAKIDETILDNAYRNSVPDNHSLIEENLSLCEIIKELSDFKIQNNTHPLFRFIENLVKSVDIKDKEISQKIKELFKNIASDLGIEPEQKKQMTSSADNNRLVDNLSPSLLVVLDPNSPEPENKEYLLQAFFMRKSDDVELWYSDDKMISIKEIPEYIEKILTMDEIGRQRKEIPNTIEFFITYKDMSHEIDRWPLSEKYFIIKRALSLEYQIVIRSLDRLKGVKNTILKKSWEKRWEKIFQNEAISIGENALFIDQSHTYNEKSFCNELGECPDISCLLMDVEPDNLIKAIVKEGIPIVIWSRKHCHNTDFQIKINSEIQGKKFLYIPEFIKKLRKNSENEEYIGNHLTLFWESPYRTLPENLYGSQFNISLQQPEQKG